MRIGGRRPAFLTPEQVAYRYFQTDSTTQLVGYDQLYRLYRIDGPLELDVLAEALRRVVAAAPVLSCSIVGSFAQRMVETPSDHPLLATSTDPDVSPDHLLRSLLDRPFPSTEPERVRAASARLGPRSTLLALAVDHLCVDPVGLSLLLDHLSRAYARARLGASDPEASGQDFLDYAAEVGTAPRRSDCAARAAALADRLPRSPSNTWLAGPLRSGRLRIEETRIEGLAYEEFTRRAGRAQATPFALCAAALAAETGGGPDRPLLLTSIASVRPSVDLASTIGMFAQPIFLQLGADGAEALVDEVGRQLGPSLALLPYAFERFYDHERARLALDPSTSPRVMLHHLVERRELSLAGCQVQRLDSDLGPVGEVAMADLHLLAFDRGDHFDLQLRTTDRAWAFGSPVALLDRIADAICGRC